MNEIEQTIRELQLYVDVRWGDSNDMFNLALTALREKAEREKAKGCEFCELTDDGYFYYAGYSKQVAVDAFDENEVDNINYCPMCGKRLEVEP